MYTKKVFRFTLFLFATAAASIASAENLTGVISGARAVGVHDGDTPYLQFPGSRKHVRVRLAEIDAPEADQEGGKGAKAALASMLMGKDLTVTITNYDRYDRPVVEIYVDDVYINGEMVRLGHAWAWEIYVTHPQLFVFEDEAKKARLGLWVDPNPIPPWKYRQMTR